MNKKFLIFLAVLILISPICGVILADIVGYHEPLDLAAEAIGLKDLSEQLNWTPFYDYSVPGLPPEIGYIISGFIGVAIIMGIGYLANLLIGKKKEKEK